MGFVPKQKRMKLRFAVLVAGEQASDVQEPTARTWAEGRMSENAPRLHLELHGRGCPRLQQDCRAGDVRAYTLRLR